MCSTYVQVGCPLEGDKQCLVWPKAGGLKVNGADFVIDPYSQGALYSTAEVTAHSLYRQKRN